MELFVGNSVEQEMKFKVLLTSVSSLSNPHLVVITLKTIVYEKFLIQLRAAFIGENLLLFVADNCNEVPQNN